MIWLIYSLCSKSNDRYGWQRKDLKIEKDDNMIYGCINMRKKENTNDNDKKYKQTILWYVIQMRWWYVN
jgi:hypothetical protein